MYHVVWLTSYSFEDVKHKIYKVNYKRKPDNYSKSFEGMDFQSAFNDFYVWFKEQGYTWDEVETDSREELYEYKKEGETVYRLWQSSNNTESDNEKQSDTQSMSELRQVI
jgi:hypothetical protein